MKEKEVVPISETPKVVFSLFETVKLSISISPRNLYISMKNIKKTLVFPSRLRKQIKM